MPLALGVTKNGACSLSINARITGAAAGGTPRPMRTRGRAAAAMRLMIACKIRRGAGSEARSLIAAAAHGIPAPRRDRWLAQCERRGPGRVALAARSIPCSISSTVSPNPAANDPLVTGANKRSSGTRWCVIVSIAAPGICAVTASIGARSSQAFATPVTRLVAPGPSVDAQTPGTPVICPTTCAIHAALAS